MWSLSHRGPFPYSKALRDGKSKLGLQWIWTGLQSASPTFLSISILEVMFWFGVTNPHHEFLVPLRHQSRNICILEKLWTSPREALVRDPWCYLSQALSHQPRVRQSSGLYLSTVCPSPSLAVQYDITTLDSFKIKLKNGFPPFAFQDDPPS